MIREADVVEEATAQESIWQFFFVVTGDYDDRALFRLYELLGLVNVEFHAVQFKQQIVRELDICFVDLINQQNNLLVSLESLPKLTLHDVVADVFNLLITQLRI